MNSSDEMKVLNCQSYEIWVGSDWDRFGAWIRERSYSRVAILVDENTKALCLPALQSIRGLGESPVLEIPSGESEKKLGTCAHIWKKMIDAGMDRSSLLINLGGGVIGDMGGFCASTFMRGIDFVQIPTTLLAQVDASVGSKLGIDFEHYKNLIGVFNDPAIVLADPGFFRTLPEEELISGFAEVIKHALIRDRELWQTLTQIEKIYQFDWSLLIYRNIQIKKEVVESDVRESGMRKILNFGHTIGHAIEAALLESGNPVSHGQAIAAGMICETFISSDLAGLPKKDLIHITEYIRKRYTLPYPITPMSDTLFRFIRHDKKNVKEQWMFSLLHEIGHCHFNIPVKQEIVEKSFIYYDAIQNKV